MNDLARYLEAVRSKSASDIVAWALRELGPGRVVIASSFGPEDQVLTEMVAAVEPTARLFTLDTGRLHQETYDTMQRTMERYGVRYDVYGPRPADIAALVREEGPNLFYESLENRRRCCEVRKTRPLKKALAGAAAWLCGLRRGQSTTREALEPIEWDATHNLYKVSPLFDWSEEQVWAYVREKNVPVSVLHSRGYRSIGCAPCTRPTSPAEDVRAGRWWWESPEHKECGLHR